LFVARPGFSYATLYYEALALMASALAGHVKRLIGG
jgi:hypothetical protein